MTQRHRSASQGLNRDALICEKFLSKLMSRDKHLNHLISGAARGRDNVKSAGQEIHPLKPRPNTRQQNITSAQSKNLGKNNLMQYADDSALVEVTVKTMNNAIRQRSKSTTDRDSWSELLKQNRSGDKLSAFGNFDPLRTLHFLAKELQLHMQKVLPTDTKIQQMVADMQHALKRVPPEVASQVHLQQNHNTHHIKTGSKKEDTLDRGVQTDYSKSFEDNENLQKLMAEGTLKLEASCKQMEKLCTDLRDEKNELEKKLIEVKQQNEILNKRVNDLETENNDVLSPHINSLEEEKQKLENQLKNLVTKIDSQSEQAINNLKSEVTELRSQKNAFEQDSNKLKHRLKMAALEREKFVAVLTLRDSQINEIRTEMSQLQELVNEQLVELHTNAFQGAPINDNSEVNIGTKPEKDKKEEMDEVTDNTISTILSNEDQHFQIQTKSDMSFKDLETCDILSNLPELDNFLSSVPNRDPVSTSLDRVDSQSNIKTMFNEIKKTAYAFIGAQKDNNYP